MTLLLKYITLLLVCSSLLMGTASAFNGSEFSGSGLGEEYNSPPYFGQSNITFYVSEGANINDPINTDDLLMASDDESDPMMYYIPSNEGEGLFRVETINGGDGLLYFKSNVSLDREERSTYTVKVYVSDGLVHNVSDNHINVTIILSDVNDNVPIFLNLPQILTLIEDISVGTVVYQVNAADNDIGSNAIITYRISSASPNSSSEVFYLNSTSGQVIVVGQLDYEANTNYILRIEASDSTLSSFGDITIFIIDINDNAPMFLASSYIVLVEEHSSIGSIGVYINAIDTDGTSPNNLVIYSIISGNTGDTFGINATSGELYLVRDIDREDIFRYSLTVLARDGPSQEHLQLSSTVQVDINIIDVNDNAPLFSAPVYTAGVQENVPIGSVVVTVWATDADGSSPNNVIVYSIISGNTGDTFRINSTTGELYLVNYVDYEYISHYSLTVLARDDPIQWQSQLNSTAQVDINILDVNDNAPWFSEAVYTVEVQENVPIGSVVVTVRATDADSGVNGDIVYRILSGIGDNRFAINENSGEVVIDNQLAVNNYTLTVQASDKGHVSLTSSVLVYITVIECTNDSYSVWSNTPYSATVVEIIPVGFQIIQVKATDVDCGLYGELNYTIVTDTGGLFSINSSTGAITTTGQLDRETTDLYNLTVAVSDVSIPVTGRLTSFVSVIVVVADVNDNMPYFESSSYFHIIPEDTPVKASVITLVAYDADSIELQYSIVSGNVHYYYRIDPTNGTVIVNSTLDYEAGESTVLTVSVTDGTYSSNATLTIVLSNVNDNPPIFSQSHYFINLVENTLLDPISLLGAFDIDSYTIVYSIDSEYFSIDPLTGTITSDTLFDYESIQRLDLTVTASDNDTNNPLSSTANLTVTIIDANDNPPIFSSSSYHYVISENYMDTIEAGIIATDRDTGIHGAVQYSIISVSPSWMNFFTINSTDATITVNGELDYENNPFIILTIVASDSSCPYHTSQALLHILLYDANDIAPLFDQPTFLQPFVTYETTVYEGLPPGSPVIKLNATDSDASRRNSLVYFSSIWSEQFEIDIHTGLIITKVSFDYEEDFQRVYSLSVIAYDQGIPELAASATVIISVLDLNDNLPYFDYSTYSVTLCNDTAPGTNILHVLANDPDSLSDPVYSITEPLHSLISFNSTTGDIYLATDIDPVYVGTNISIELHAADGDNIPVVYTTSCTINIIISDCQVIGISHIQDTYIGETASLYTVIATINVQAVHPDLHQYSILPFTNSSQFAPFNIVSSGVIIINNTLNARTKSIYTLQIQITDSALNRAYTIVTVHVYGLGLPPGVGYHYVFSLYEETLNVLVGNATAVITGSYNSTSIRYALSSSTIPAMVDPFTGAVVVSEVDKETMTPILTIQAQLGDITDFNISVYLQILGVNDNSPQFDQLYYTANVSEYTLVGSTVGHVSATDLDKLDVPFSDIYYSIESGSDGKFAIEFLTGAVYTLAPLDYSNTSFYNLSIRARDDIYPIHFSDTHFEITIINEIDCPTEIHPCVEGSMRLSPFVSEDSGIISPFLSFSYIFQRFRYLTIKGPVEVCVSGKYWSLCNDGVDDAEHVVSLVCRQLGYYGDHSNSIGLSTNEEYIDNITCASDSLQGCTVTVYNESSCVDNSRLYADCSSTELSCESEEGFLMYNTTTVVNGVTATFGIPTFCEHGTPFVFCNDGTFDISGVIPICQTLGYESGTHLDYNSTTVLGALPIGARYYTFVPCQNFASNSCLGLTDCYNGGAYIVECTKNYSSVDSNELSSTSFPIVSVPSSTVPLIVSSTSQGAISSSSSTPSLVYSPTPSPPTTVIPTCATVTDNVHGLVWTKVIVGEMLTQSCPTGRLGNISRVCTSDGWTDISLTECPIIVLVDTADKLKNISQFNLTSQEENNAVNTAIEGVNNVTANETLVSSDVVIINDIVSTSITILSNNIGNIEIVNPFLETGILKVFNTLLDDQYIEEWEEAQTVDQSGERLMENIEQYGNYAGVFLRIYNDTGDTINGTFTSERENMVFQVEVLPNDGLRDVIFPLNSELHTYTVNNSFSQVRIPYQHLENRQGQGSISVVNSLVKNIANYLSSSLPNNTVPGSQVISTQVIAEIDYSDIPAVFTFTTFPFMNATNPRCVFWDFSANTSRGQWSTRGIDEISTQYEYTEDGYIQIIHIANSSHITPFVVLVDVHNVELSEDEYIALEVVTYGGLTASSICCILTLIVLGALRKELIVNALYFIHFNLSATLLAGYLVFIFGIDDKVIDLTNNKIGCGFIAGLLHYFFMASFCWMLCEGLMLFLQIVIVFNSFTKRWYLFLLIGWGLPVLPVAITVSIIYNDYGVIGKYCWLNFGNRIAVWAFLGPALLIVIINTILLMCIIMSLVKYHKRREEHKGQQNINKYYIARQTLIGTLTLLPLLGITWPVSLLCFNNDTTVFAWIFTIMATLQGCFIFVFNVIRNEKIRTAFMKICCTRIEKSRQQKQIKAAYAHNNYIRSKRDMHQVSSFISDGYGTSEFHQSTFERDHQYDSTYKRPNKSPTQNRRIGVTSNNSSGSKLSNNLSQNSIPTIHIDTSTDLYQTKNNNNKSSLVSRNRHVADEQNTPYLQVPKVSY